VDRQGLYISGLTKQSFTVLDDKAPQEIAFFGDADEPISIGIIFDLSGSMTGEKIGRARTALAHFIQTSSDSDEYSLIGFDSHARLLADRTRDADMLLRKLDSVTPRGSTALYDGLYLGVEKVMQGAHPKKALLLITDGGENDSRYTRSELHEFLEESGVILYSVCVLDRINLAGKAGFRVQNLLKGLSAVTGGRAFFPDSAAEMDEMFERIALELRHQYSIGYRPSNFITDGRWHRVKVKVTTPAAFPHLTVRSKEGYYAFTAAH
jgi:Ca-activated chloride channel family protein